MPIGFNLFSFDFFEAFRRNHDQAGQTDAASSVAQSKASVDEDAEERERQQAADQRFWGLGYFPVL